jgi:fido (protein-threonine AMPylation protein)
MISQYNLSRMVFQPKPDRQWQRIVEAGLCPEIKDFATYEAKTLIQLQRAFDASMADPQIAPTPARVAALHKIIFEGVHPWAGTFRQLGQTVRFDHGVLGTDAHRVTPDLQRIQEETALALAQARTPQEQAVAVVCYHARYRRVHPFLDGNTRTSAVLLQSQIKAIFQIDQLTPQYPDDYKQKLAQAYRGEIAPLANHILTVVGQPPIAPTHIRLPAPMFDQDLETEIVKHREEILARQRGQGKEEA